MSFLIMLVAIIMTALLSVSGGVFLLLGRGKIVRSIQKVGPLIAFLVLLFAVFGDIVPEILEEEELSVLNLCLLIGGGFVAASLIGFFMGKFHHHNDIHQHNHSKEKIETHGDKAIKSKTQAYTMLAVDSVHAIADGVVLGSSFVASPTAGLSACLATVAHEIPQEIGDFSIMQRAKLTNKKILKYQILSSLVAVPAAILSYFVGNTLLESLPVILAIVAGFLLYVAFGELICMIESLKNT